jgi:hypothetical protein
VVITASSTPVNAARTISFAVSAGEDAQRCAAGSHPRRDVRPPRVRVPTAEAADDPAGVWDGLGRPVLTVYGCSGPNGSTQHT